MGRWKVHRLPTASPWRNKWVARKSGATDWRQFPSWREAFDFADREARR